MQQIFKIFFAILPLSLPVLAQTTQLPDPNAPNPKTTVPEKIEPPGERTQPAPTVPPSKEGTLSDRLNKSDGVIRPPTDGTPDMRVPAPVPNPNTTPVIPPPGSPGNPSPVVPK